MDVRIFLFVLIIVLGLFLKLIGETSKLRKIYINIILIALVLESCLRGLSVGSDTYKYSELFAEVGSMNWKEVFDAMVNRYVNNVNDSDAGYLLFEKVIYSLSTDFNVFLLACALCFFIPFRKLIYWMDLDMSSLIFMFVLYVALFNPIAMSGTRKEIALGLSIVSFISYAEKRYLKALLFLVFGALIHMTMIIITIIPIIDLLSSRLKKTIHGISFLFIPFMILFSSNIIFFMASTIENDHYLIYVQNPEGGGLVFIVLMEAILLACLVFFRVQDLDKSSKISHLYSVLPGATLLVPLIANNGSMIRLSQYFHVYVLVFLPILVYKIGGNYYRVLLSTLLIVILIAMSLNTNGLGSNYYFFWNDPLSNGIDV